MHMQYPLQGILEILEGYFHNHTKTYKETNTLIRVFYN
jgi:hypothetical protein